MSSGTVRRVSSQDIQAVQNLIEQCLQLYMSQKEAVETLMTRAKIEPGFTELVWQKLEEENQDFFKAYYLRLMVKHQIIEFNKLLEQQVQLMHQIIPTGVASISTSNGSNVPPFHQNSASYPSEHTGPALKPENMRHPIGSTSANTFTNGGSPLPTSLHSAVDMSSQVNRIDSSPDMLSTQSSNVDLIQGVNGEMIKQEVGYAGNSSYLFGTYRNVMELRPPIADASVASFSNIKSTPQNPNEPLLDAGTTLCGFLGQISKSWSLSDLTSHFSQSSDILEDYPRSPFLETDAANFLNSHENKCQGPS